MVRYVVQPGDTLANIASKYQTRVEAIAWANGIRNPNMIHAGQILRIPTDEYDNNHYHYHKSKYYKDDNNPHHYSGKYYQDDNSDHHYSGKHYKEDNNNHHYTGTYYKTDDNNQYKSKSYKHDNNHYDH